MYSQLAGHRGWVREGDVLLILLGLQLLISVVF